MKQLDVAEAAVQAMVDATTLYAQQEQQEQQNDPVIPTPISVKCRIGVDEYDSLDYLTTLVRRLSQHCKVFHLHARKAILGGLLTPAQNRAVPPLNYPRVYEICRLFPDCDFYINGGIKTLKQAKDICYGRDDDADHDNTHGTVPCNGCQFSNGSCIAPPTYPAPLNLRGCLMGRVAMDNPCVLWDIDRYFYGEKQNPCDTRRKILHEYCTYIESIYPRRCCDKDPFVTTKITDQKGFDFDYSYCSNCSMLYASEEGLVENELSIAPPDYLEEQTMKISTHIMNRCTKPIHNIFFGLPKANQFRQEIHRLGRKDMGVRNCGPASLIRRALLVMPDEYLDLPLTPTEEQ
jgi:hypothetical protein